MGLQRTARLQLEHDYLLDDMSNANVLPVQENCTLSFKGHSRCGADQHACHDVIDLELRPLRTTKGRTARRVKNLIAFGNDPLIPQYSERGTDVARQI